jgi:hypothetical protein
MQQFNDRIESLWQGAIDIHVHAAPDPIASRRHDALELALACRDAGMRAIIFKSHEYPTVPAAYVLNRVVDDFTVFGALSLDYEVGGLNPAALEASAKLGAAKVWFPTFSAAFWRQTRHGASDGLTVLGDDGTLLPVVNELLDLIDQYDMILGTGHLGPDEQRVLVPEARRRDIKTVITHAEVTPIPVELTAEFSAQGAFVEHAYIALTRTPGAEGSHSFASVAAGIRQAGPGQAILSTDLGQAANPSPPEGLRMFIAGMLSQGFTDEEVRRMVNENPAGLLGLA